MNAIGANDSVCSGDGLICEVQDDGSIEIILILNVDKAFAHVYAIFGNTSDEVVDKIYTLTRLQSCRALLGVDQFARVLTVALGCTDQLSNFLLP